VPVDPLQRRWCQALCRRQHGRLHKRRTQTQPCVSCNCGVLKIDLNMLAPDQALVPGSKPLILSMHFAKSSSGWKFCLLLVLASFAAHACGAAECRDLVGRLGMEGNAYTGRYSEELVATAKRLASAGKGILAADESTGTVGKRVRDVEAPCHCRRLSSVYLPCHPRSLTEATRPSQARTEPPRHVHAVGRHQRRE